MNWDEVEQDFGSGMTTRQCAEMAADTLLNYFSHGRRWYIGRPVYGLFRGDVMLSWCIGRAHANALRRWYPSLRVQFIGRYKCR